MTRKRAGSAARFLVGALLVASLAGCGGAGKTPADPPTTSTTGESTSGTPTGSDTSGSSFPSSADLPDGPWIPLIFCKVKVPKGFKGEAGMGVVTLLKGTTVIQLIDAGGLGVSTIEDLADKEKETNFNGKTSVEFGTATVDGVDVQTFMMSGKDDAYARVSYGMVLTDKDGDPTALRVAFVKESGDPANDQDLIASVLSSIRWDPKHVG